MSKYEDLTIPYHDQPERHRYGHALFEPGTPSTITPLVTQTADSGSSDAPARGDHTHGLTGIQPAAAFSQYDIAPGANPVKVGTGAFIVGLTGGSYASIQNVASFTRLAMVSIRCDFTLDNVGAVNAAGYVYHELAASITGAPAAPTVWGGLDNTSGLTLLVNETFAHSACFTTFYNIPSGQYLNVNARDQFYGANANIRLYNSQFRIQLILMN